jgi:hypothetical protein
MNWKHLCIAFLLLLVACLIGYQNNRSAFYIKESMVNIDGTDKYKWAPKLISDGIVRKEDLQNYLKSADSGLTTNQRDLTEYLDKFAIFARMNYKNEGGYLSTEGIRPLLDVNLIHSTDTINNDDITLQLFLHKREKKNSRN